MYEQDKRMHKSSKFLAYISITNPVRGDLEGTERVPLLVIRSGR